MPSESKLIAAIERAEKLADDGDVAEARAEALAYYQGDPFGNEVEGRSQVVSRDVSDTIEWIKPALAKIFLSGDEVVQFNPTGPEDEKAAEQETDYINHIITQKNNGFLIFMMWFHDALLQKNGYVKAYWEEKTEVEEESYAGLSEDEALLLLEDQELEVVGHEETADAMGTTHTVRVKQKRTYGCVKVDNVPPENVKVSANSRSVGLSCADFVEQVEMKTISDLREEGFDVDDDISDNSGDLDEDYEADLRDENDIARRDDEGADPSMRRVRVREVWIRMDYDDDGIAELRHVIVVGSTVLLNGTANFIPMACLSPSPQPHVHYGVSVAEMVMDLQAIKSYLLRAAIDNQALANNGRYAIDEKAVDLDDMLDSRPGGVVRVKGNPANSIFPLVHPTNGQAPLMLMEYVDTVKENRTGVTRYNQGIDANSLNKTAQGINQIMTAAQQRTELIARFLAETGVKELFLIVHALSLKHGRKAELVRLRNQWVQVDPRQWKKRVDMTVSVGLGTGSRDMQTQYLMQILGLQQQAMAIGIASPPKIYNAAAKLTQNLGFKDPNLFWDDPSQNPPQPPGPPPEVQAAQIKAQTELQAKQMEVQQKAEADANGMTLEQWKAQQDAQTKILLKQMELGAQAQMQDKQAQNEDRRFQYQQETDKRNHQFSKQQHKDGLRAQGVEVEDEVTAEEGEQIKAAIGEIYGALQEIIAKLNEPKEIQRDAMNRAIAINGRPIKRDQNNRIIGY